MPSPGPTRTSGVASSDTPERLLDAAEELIATIGVEAASVRAVNALAGRNPAAVHYHFGSKEALVRSALDRRMLTLGARRTRMLATLEGATPPTPRDAVAVLVLPLADIRRTEPWGATYVRFLDALTQAGEPWRRLIAAAFEPQRANVDAVIARALPELSPTMRAVRLTFVGRSSVSALANLDEYTALLRREPDPEQAAVDALIDVLAACLAAPADNTNRRS